MDQTMHQFTPRERSLGGSRTKYNNLRTGRYAEKLSQVYICPGCHTPISAGKIREQDALMARFASKDAIYQEVKRNLVLMDDLLATTDDTREQFIMAEKLNTLLLKVSERTDETKSTAESFSMKKLLDDIKQRCEGEQ